MNMYVVPAYRNKKIARKLLNCAITYAKEHQIVKVMLNPSEMGKSLYMNYGFRLNLNEYDYYM